MSCNNKPPLLDQYGLPVQDYSFHSPNYIPEQDRKEAFTPLSTLPTEKTDSSSGSSGPKKKRISFTKTLRYRNRRSASMDLTTADEDEGILNSTPCSSGSSSRASSVTPPDPIPITPSSSPTTPYTQHARRITELFNRGLRKRSQYLQDRAVKCRSSSFDMTDMTDDPHFSSFQSVSDYQLCVERDDTSNPLIGEYSISLHS